MSITAEKKYRAGQVWLCKVSDGLKLFEITEITPNALRIESKEAYPVKEWVSAEEFVKRAVDYYGQREPWVFGLTHIIRGSLD